MVFTLSTADLTILQGTNWSVEFLRQDENGDEITTTLSDVRMQARSNWADNDCGEAVINLSLGDGIVVDGGSITVASDGANWIVI